MDTTSSPAADLSGSIAGRDHKALDRMRAALNASKSALATEGAPQDAELQSSQNIAQPAAQSTAADLPVFSPAPSFSKAGYSFPKQNFGHLESRSSFGQFPPAEEKTTIQLPRYSGTLSTHEKTVDHQNNRNRNLQDSPKILRLGFSEKSEITTKEQPNPPIGKNNTSTYPSTPKSNRREIESAPGIHITPGTPIHSLPLNERETRRGTSFGQKITGSTQFAHLVQERRREQDEREDKKIEIARRGAIASEAALRAERNRTLEAKKEAAFFREEAARARDEAMLSRKGMWLGLMAGAVSAFIAAAPYIFR